MKNNLLIILLALGLLIPAKQTVAQLLPKPSTLKEQQKSAFRNNTAKAVKLKKESTFVSTSTKKHKVNNLTYQPIASLPYSNTSTLDENSSMIEQPFLSPAEGYSLALTKGESIRILLRSTDFESSLFLLDSNYNTISFYGSYFHGDDSCSIVFSSFYTGTHYIVVAGFDEEIVGDYTISVDYYLNSLSTQKYYVDALNGDDANTGQSPTSAKQTIQSVLGTTTNGTIYIMSDIALDTTITIENASTICLAAYDNNTYTIKRTNNCTLVPMVDVYGSILYIGSENMGGKLIFDGGYNDTATLPLMAMEALMLDLESIVFIYPFVSFQNNYSEYSVIYNEGFLCMQGGDISNNIGSAVESYGNFLMLNGDITNNEAYNYSGVSSGLCFMMYGGNISNNKAARNSGVENGGFFYMYGGTVSENEAETFGGIYNGAYFFMHGGTVSENEADVFSGICNDGYFFMTEGNVIDNQADMASGITNYGVAMISGGGISDNIATTMSSGVINEEDGEMCLSGGNISGNISHGIPNNGLTHIGFSCLLSDSVTIGSDNQIFLLEGKTIEVNGSLTSQTVGTILPFKYAGSMVDYAHRVGLQILSGTTNEIATDYTKFEIANDENNGQWYLTSLGKLASDDVSIADYTNESSLNVYPNPATDILEININNMELGQMYLKIYDISGKQIRKIDIFESQTKISVKDLANGVYMVQLFSNTQMIESKKLIKK